MTAARWPGFTFEASRPPALGMVPGVNAGSQLSPAKGGTVSAPQVHHDRSPPCPMTAR